MKSTVQLLSATILVLMAFSTQAQVYEQGKTYVNAGIGFGNRYTLSNTDAGLSFGATYEYGYTENIGFGGIFGYSSASDALGTYSLVSFGGRGVYHFAIDNDKIDLYSGVSISYYTWNGDNIVSGASGVSLGVFAGGRYMFSEKFGGFAELGYTIAYLNIGVTFKY